MRKIPADIALDVTYRTELQQGGAMIGFPNAASATSQEFDQQIVKSAEGPLFSIPKQPDPDPKLTQHAVQDPPPGSRICMLFLIGKREIFGRLRSIHGIGTGTVAAIYPVKLLEGIEVSDMVRRATSIPRQREPQSCG
jgi:hypothetical protein